MLVSSLREAVYSTKPPKGLRLLEKYERTVTSPTIRSQLKRLQFQPQRVETIDLPCIDRHRSEGLQ